MTTFFKRTLCAATVISLVAALGPVNAQTTDAVEIDPDVVRALGRDLGLNPRQAVERVTAERNATQRHTAVRQALGTAYAGAWFDPADQKLVVATSDPRMSKAVLASGARPVVVKRSFQELTDIQKRLDQSAIQLSDKHKKMIWQWGVDVMTNAVVITIPTGDPEALLAAQDFITLGKVDAKAIRIEQSREGPPTLLQGVQTLRGGDRYNKANGSWCSVGFAVTGGYVTAGHCVSTNEFVDGYDYTDQGTVMGSQYPGEDRAWVQTLGNWVPSQCVGTGANRDCTAPNNRAIAGSQASVVNTSVCRWGATTGGPHCGAVQALDVSVTFTGGNTVHHLTKTSACAQGGDSGGPFVWNNHGQGTLTGGSQGATCPGSSTSYFYPLNLTLNHYGLTLTVASGPPPPSPTNFSVTYTYFGGKYRFTATWTGHHLATIYHMTGHIYNGGSATGVSWTVPENYEDLSIEYHVTACNAFGCSAPAGPVYVQ